MSVSAALPRCETSRPISSSVQSSDFRRGLSEARQSPEQESCLIVCENSAEAAAFLRVEGIQYCLAVLAGLHDCWDDPSKMDVFRCAPWPRSCSTGWATASRTDSRGARPLAVTNSSLHRGKPTLVSISDNTPTLNGAAYNHEDLFAGYGRHRAFDEMFGRSGEVRAHCLPLYEVLRGASSDRARRAADGGRQGLSHPGHHLHGLRRRAGHRADLSVRPRPARDHRGGVGDARTRPDPAAHRHQPVLEGRLSRRPDPGRGRGARASWSRAAAISAARCAASRSRAASMCRWPAPTSSAARTEASSSSKTTSACRAACRTCSPTGK